MSENKISNIAYIEELLTKHKKGLTFEEISAAILNYSGIALTDHSYYSQVLEDMARSGTIVRDGEGKYFLKTLRRELWDTPFYNFNLSKEDFDSSDEAGKYEKNSKFDNMEYEDDIDLEEILNEIDVDIEDEEYEAETSEDTIEKEAILDGLEDEFEEEDFDEDDDFDEEDEDY
jgi:hypothetical protein